MYTGAMEEQSEASADQVRFWMYGICSAIAILMFLLFTGMGLMVPGILLGTKILMLGSAGLAAAVSLAVGAWKFNTRDVPISAWPLGALTAVILLLQFACCLFSVIALCVTPL